MGLRDIFKKKQQAEQTAENAILLAMPLFTNGDRYHLTDVLEHLKSHWGLAISNTEGNDDTAIITVDGESAAIAFMPVPIPSGDIDGTLPYAYNWPTAKEDLTHFTGHAIVSMLTGTKTTLERYILFSKVLHSILATSQSVGIYQGGQTLLIPREQYLESAEGLHEDLLPVDLWIYLGLRRSESGNSVYTYGLSGFGKNEMEVINSALGLDELYDFMANICAYVVGSNVTLRNGETIGFSAEQKIKITHSKGQFVEGESLKLHL